MEIKNKKMEKIKSKDLISLLKIKIMIKKLVFISYKNLNNKNLIIFILIFIILYFCKIKKKYYE